METKKVRLFKYRGQYFRGQVVGETAKNLSERFGKVLQKRQSLSAMQ
jgi:hypothetical protein